MDAVEALRFQPNRSARALVAHRQKSQGVLPDGGQRLVCVGQVCVEHVISLPRIPAPGLRTTSRTMFKTPGGHAATVAVFAAGVGAPFAVAADLVTGLCDDDESHWVVSALAERSVNVISVGAPGNGQLNQSVLLLEDDGQRTVIEEAPSEPLDAVEARLLPILGDRDATVLFDATHLEVGLSLAQRLRQRNCAVVFHGTGLERAGVGLSAIADAFDLVFVDDATLGALGVSERSEMEAVLGQDIGGPCSGVVVADGACPAVLYRRQAPPLRALPLAAGAVDVTGASDAFAGVFLASWLCQGDPVTALHHAQQGAGLAARGLGAQGRLVRWTDLEGPAEPVSEGA